MKSGAGKRKGSQFERAISKQISLWWSNGEYHDICWRTSSSGAHGTISKSKVSGHWGDICAAHPSIEPLFKICCFELKHYKEIDITEVLRELKNNKLLIFWNQTLRSAVFSGRIPVLLCKTNNFPTMLVMKKIDAFAFVGVMNKKLPFISIGEKLCVFNFDSFLENANKDKFIRLVNQLAQ